MMPGGPDRRMTTGAESPPEVHGLGKAAEAAAALIEAGGRGRPGRRHVQVRAVARIEIDRRARQVPATSRRRAAEIQRGRGRKAAERLRGGGGAVNGKCGRTGERRLRRELSLLGRPGERRVGARRRRKFVERRFRWQRWRRHEGVVEPCRPRRRRRGDDLPFGSVAAGGGGVNSPEASGARLAGCASAPRRRRRSLRRSGSSVGRRLACAAATGSASRRVVSSLSSSSSPSARRICAGDRTWDCGNSLARLWAYHVIAINDV